MLNQSANGLIAAGTPEAVHDSQITRGGDSKDLPLAAGAAEERGPVEIPVCALNQRGERGRAVSLVERVQGGQRAGGGDSEDRAIVMCPFGCPVKISVVALDQRGVWKATVCAAAEAIQYRKDAAEADREYFGIIVGAPLPRCSVKQPVACLNQSGGRKSGVAPGEVVHRSKGAVGRHFEDGAVLVGPALVCGAVKHAIERLDQSAFRRNAIGVIEAVQRRERSNGGDTEHVAFATADRRSVKQSVGCEQESGGRVSATEGIVEGEQAGKDATGGYAEYCARVVGFPAVFRGAVHLRGNSLYERCGRA